MDVELIRQICLSLSGVSESVKWGNNLVFSVGEKMFCIVNLDLPFRCSFKVADDDFETLCEQEGFSPAPHLARAKWASVTEPSILTKKDWQEHLSASYRLVRAKLPRKLKGELGFTD